MCCVPPQTVLSGPVATGRRKRYLLSELGSESLHAIVEDSYVRGKVAIPSSLASFMPKVQLFCPQVRKGDGC